MPTPTMLTRRARTASSARAHRCRTRGTALTLSTSRPRRDATPGRAACRLPAASPARRGRSAGPRASRTAAGRRRSPTPACAGRPAPAHPRAPGSPRAARDQRRQERLRMHQRDEARHVTEPEAGHQTRLQRELLAQLQGLAHPHEVRRVCQLVVDAVQAAVRRDDAVAQDLAQAHHLERRRAALGVTGQALLADDEQRRARRASHRGREPLVQLGLVGIVGQRRRVVLGHHRDVVGTDAELGQRARPAATPCRRGPRRARRAPAPGSRCARRRRTTTRSRRPPAPADPSPARGHRGPAESCRRPGDSTKPSLRRSLARENFESLMPLARIVSVSAVADMSPKPMMASSVRSS